MIKLLLPLPAKELSPNSRGSWRKSAPVKAAARADGYLVGRAARFRSDLTFEDMLQVQINVTWPNSSRKRDLDNMLASNKAVIDGVFDGLGLNDAQIKRWIVEEMPASKKNAGIELIITRKDVI